MSKMDPFSGALRRGWWLPVLSALVAMLVAGWMTTRQEPVYRARALLAVAPNSAVDRTDDILDSLETLERRTVVATLARIPGSADTLARAAARLELRPRDVRGYRVTGSVLPNTNLIQIQVSGRDPGRTARLAGAVAAETQIQARAIYGIYSLRLIETPREPSRPESPDWKRNVAQALLLGLFLGALAAFAVELLRGRARAVAG